MKSKDKGGRIPRAVSDASARAAATFVLRAHVIPGVAAPLGPAKRPRKTTTVPPAGYFISEKLQKARSRRCQKRR